MLSKLLKTHKIKLTILSVLLLLWIFCLPSPLFDVPSATVVESSDGHLLGARIADDGQWRFPQIDSMPFRFEQCLLLFEDEYFYSHPGFNPVSISKAFWNNLSGKSRRGASTITQQVIRLSRKNKKRTYFEKAIEIIQATRLEAGNRKKTILNLYASHAPFGGNVVGLETASWRYFGIPSNELSWGQAAALAVLPNAPALIFPGKNEELLKEKRNKLLRKLFDKGIIDAATFELAKEEALPGKPYPLPDIAPHLVEKVRKEHSGKHIKTTVNFDLQKKVNRIAETHYYTLRQNEIHNLAILVLDVETRDILAYVGNSPTTSEYKNHVDIIQNPRSTGSILKPFLFSSMLQSGEILPDMLVADVPTSINGYNPQNYDRKFYGAVPASVGLARSLNVPAVRMLREFGIQRF
ncbi:MAG: transglycosylase domain-containing protein, partial [Bacteroidetes bacterium]|nr:transglycosylase domain-containing protein [Bacteroidota bacterium]